MNNTTFPVHDFSPEGYRQLVRQFKKQGYRFCNFLNLSPDKPDVVMRHDVDLSLDYAVKLAELESQESIKTVYYVLVCSEFYNIMTPASRVALKQILDLGHEVGLHFDASIYNHQAVELESIAALECNLLESITGEPVRTISFHRPAKQFQGRPGNFAGRIHTYQPKFFSEIDYCADSTGCWRFGHPLDRDSVKQGKAIQVVTHPIWWNPDLSLNTIGKIEDFRRNREHFLRRELGRNLTPYAEYLQIAKV